MGRELTWVTQVTAYTAGRARDGTKSTWLVHGYCGMDCDEKWWVRFKHPFDVEDIGPFDTAVEANVHALKVANLRDAYVWALTDRFGDSLLQLD